MATIDPLSDADFDGYVIPTHALFFIHGSSSSAALDRDFHGDCSHRFILCHAFGMGNDSVKKNRYVVAVLYAHAALAD